MDGITFSIAVIDPGASTPTSGGADNEGGAPDDLFQTLLAQVLAAGQLAPNQPTLVDVAPVATEAADAVSAIALNDRMPARFVRVQTPEGSTFEALIGKLALSEQAGRQIFDVTEAVRLIAETANAASVEPAPAPSAAALIDELLQANQPGRQVSDVPGAARVIAQAADTASAMPVAGAPTTEPSAAPKPFIVRPVPVAVPGNTPAANVLRAVPTEVAIKLPVGANAVANAAPAAENSVPAIGTEGPFDDAAVTRAGTGVATLDRAVVRPDEPAEALGRDTTGVAPDRLTTTSLAHRFVEAHQVPYVESQGTTPAADLVRQVTDQIHRLSVEGKSELSFQLKPETLGRLDVRISVEGGNVTVQLGTQTGEARGMIENNLAQLRTALAEQGLRVDRLVVYVGQHLAGFDTSAHQQGTWADRPGRRRALVESVELDVDGQPPWWPSAARIDCRV